MSKQGQQSVRISAELTAFFYKYEAVLVAAANYVHARHKRGHLYTKTEDVARWVSNDLPALYASVFGRGEQRRLRVYRVRHMLGDARFMGVFEALGIRGVPGRGLTVLGAGSKARGARHLRLVHSS